MDARVAILTVPSLVVLGLLVFHSARALPRRRAIAFWSSVVAYGIVRGISLRWVIAHGGGSAFPYTIHQPLFPIFGVPLQELAGWAIVGYLGWFLGSRLARNPFTQVVWGSLFLGAISWAVESSAVAAGWWSWTIPVTNPLFAGVPFIAIVDWFFVGIDFMLPFVVVTAPAFRDRPLRFVSLLAFPVHFGAHCFSATSLGGIPAHHLAHWILLAVLLVLSFRSQAEDAAFGEERSWLPWTGLAIVLLDAALVDAFVVKRPALLLSLLPAMTLSLHTVRPLAGYAAAVTALALGAWLTPFAVAAAPPAVAGLLTWGRRYRWLAPIAAVTVLGLAAARVHATGARDQEELTRRLDAAIAARDRGDLEASRRELAALTARFPGSHVPSALLGEIDYRTERLDAARSAFLQAVAIKQDYARGYRYLAVIELRSARTASAAAFAAKGQELSASDPELSYLVARARGDAAFAARVPLGDVQMAQTLAALAFEVGDTEGAALLLDRGLAQWPEQRSFYPSRVNVAMQQGDDAGVQRVVAQWRTRFPGDTEARQLSRRLGME